MVGEKGVPLTITPPLDKHRPDAAVGREIDLKGIELNAMDRMRCGAAGFFVWNSAIAS